MNSVNVAAQAGTALKKSELLHVFSVETEAVEQSDPRRPEPR